MEGVTPTNVTSEAKPSSSKEEENQWFPKRVKGGGCSPSQGIRTAVHNAGKDVNFSPKPTLGTGEGSESARAKRRIHPTKASRKRVSRLWKTATDRRLVGEKADPSDSRRRRAWDGVGRRRVSLESGRKRRFSMAMSYAGGGPGIKPWPQQSTVEYSRIIRSLPGELVGVHRLQSGCELSSRVAQHGPGPPFNKSALLLKGGPDPSWETRGRKAHSLIAVGALQPNLPGPTSWGNPGKVVEINKRGETVDEKMKKLDSELARYKEQIKKSRPGPAQEALKARAMRVLKQRRMYDNLLLFPYFYKCI
ncbi:hypothetical protein KSP40_PGU015017 [Platanthera guangdongensis]|uniref:Uncharacterized protein n=1 Tax=Platanthera guangdongensis TaxID=2320717 RepID=A0ABR2N1S4_9ASPA